MKWLFSFLLVITCSFSAHAHTLSLLIADQGDGLIMVRGEFSTGQSAAGALVKFQALKSGVILYQKRLPESSELEAKIPSQPYEIILDGGPGHSAIKPGIAPPGGYTSQGNGVADANVHSFKQAKGCSAEQILWAISSLLWAVVFWSAIRSHRFLKSTQLPTRKQ